MPDPVSDSSPPALPPDTPSVPEPPATDEPSPRRWRWTTEQISAAAAVAGVVIAGVGLFIGTRDDDPVTVPATAMVRLESLTNVGPSAFGAAGGYQALPTQEQEVAVVIRLQDAPTSGEWRLVRGERTPTSRQGTLEDGNWEAVIPLTSTTGWQIYP